MISIQMLKICDESICKPQRIKKANTVSVFKKDKNSKEISLHFSLPVSRKIFERLLHGSIFKVFTKNKFIIAKQSGFKPGDSCTNQLLSFTQQIYKSFDDD